MKAVWENAALDHLQDVIEGSKLRDQLVLFVADRVTSALAERTFEKRLRADGTPLGTYSPTSKQTGPIRLSKTGALRQSLCTALVSPTEAVIGFADAENARKAAALAQRYPPLWSFGPAEEAAMKQAIEAYFQNPH
jgi:hypothetical protein